MYELPDGTLIDLRAVVGVSKPFANKTDSNYNCYDLLMQCGRSFTVYESEVTRNSIVVLIEAAKA